MTVKTKRKKHHQYGKPFHYESLETIPYKTFLKVAASADLSLLSNTETNFSTLAKIWDAMFKQHLDYDPTSENKKQLRLHKAIDVLLGKYNFVTMAISEQGLQWECDEELVQQVRDFGFQLRDDNNENYHNDLERIGREVNSFIIQANALKKQLPKPKENEVEGEASFRIDDVMASYTVILGVTFDFNKVTYTAFRGFEKQVNAKIEALKAQTAQANQKTRK